MDTFTPLDPFRLEPVPTRSGREGRSRRRTIATSLVVAGLTATGGLAVILSTAATGGATDTAAVPGGGPAQAPATPTSVGAAGASGAQSGAAGATTTSSAAPATTGPASSAVQSAASSGTAGQSQPGSRPQPPQAGQGPGHAAAGGS